MPLDVRTDAPQALLDWGSRTGFFLGIGLLMAGVISRRNRAEKDRAKREAELEALRAIDLSILGVAPFEETVSIAQEALGRLMRVDRLGRIILGGDRARIHRYWVSRGGEAHEAVQNLPAEGPLARALRSGEVASGIVDPTGSDWEGELAAEGLRSYLVVPLVAAREVVGAVAASSRRGAPFPMGEVDTAGRVAAQLAVALRLRESEHRYRTLFDHMPVGLFRSTPDGRILDANQALVQMLGYPDLESLLSVNARDLYPGPEARTWWEDQRQASGTSSLEMP
jgi:PAS domain-containing protein